MASLVGVVIQDIGLFILTDAVKLGGPVVLVLQGLVLLISIGLVLLARKASAQGWIG
jgi:glucose dehydrogenase